MAKARILAVVIIGILLLTAIVPSTVLGAPPAAPTDLSPANNTENISLTPTFLATYTGTDPNVQFAAWWQCTTVAGDYSDGVLVFNTGVDQANLVQVTSNRGLLQPSTTYYWRVRQQDIYGDWSPWSAEQKFTTVTLLNSQVINSSPVNDAEEVTLSHKFGVLYLNPQGDAVNATQWQWRTPGGNYGVPLYDSGVVSGSSLVGVYPVGTFDYGNKYYWHVRVQDVMGIWSDWSDETSFTVIANSPPAQPSNVEPADEAETVGLTPVLKASAFSDPNAPQDAPEGSPVDTHAASRWQIAASASHDKNTDGSYKNLAYDSDNVTIDLTQIVIPAGNLAADTPYYWHVRYQDSYGNWSAYSEETSFTTKSMDVPVAGFTADKTEVVAGEQAVTFTDTSTPAGEIANWSWNFGDGTTENWTLRNRPATGTVSHIYTEGGTYTVSLVVSNGAGSDPEVKAAFITVIARPKAVIAALTPKTAKAGEGITLYETSTGDITQLVWDFGDGTDLVQWDKDARATAVKKINHTFKKAGTYIVTLKVVGTIQGQEVENSTNWQIEVSGSKGFGFELWMVGVAVAAIVVVAGVMYLVRARKGK